MESQTRQGSADRGSPPPRRGDRRRDRGPRRPPIETFFAPDRAPAELVDELAERQAMQFRPGEIGAAQLRRFFGEVKDLHRRLGSGNDQEYHKTIEPLFKMLRSKAFYSARTGNQRIPDGFARFIDNGVRQVKTADSFRSFALHFEAVVGFLYGKGRVRNE